MYLIRVRLKYAFICGVLLAVNILLASKVEATNVVDQSTMRTVTSSFDFDTLSERLEHAILANGLAVVAQASASKGAKARGVEIPGNVVVMVFRNDYAVRMLEASISAGIEAPLRLYLTESSDGSASISYYYPSSIFARYGNNDLDDMAKELDPIIENIVRDAVRD